MEFKSYFEFGGLTSFLLFLDQQTIPGPNKKENINYSLQLIDTAVLPTIHPKIWNLFTKDSYLKFNIWNLIFYIWLQIIL